MELATDVSRCPVCRAVIDPTADRTHRPFCSERCRWVDLSRWLGGEYVIPGEPVLDGPAIDDLSFEE